MKQFNIIVQIFICCCVLHIPLVVHGEINSNGMCNLLMFTQFTTGGIENRHFSGTIENNLGFSHLSSAILAMEQFNARDSSIVPELNSSLLDNCFIQFDFNSSNFFDTGGYGKKGLKQIQQSILKNGPPCSIIGGYNDEPIKDLSIIATSIEIPIITHRGKDVTISYQKSYPFLSQTYPSSLATIAALMSYIIQLGRNDFIAILYSLDDISLQITTGIVETFKDVHIRTRTFGFLSNTNDVPPIPGANSNTNNISSTIKDIKDSNFRTIIVVSDGYLLDSTLPIIAKEANEYGLTNGNHFWLFFGGLELSYVSDPNTKNDPIVSKLLQGAALLLPIEPFLVHPSSSEDDKFLASWKQQDVTFLNQVKTFNPITEGMPGYYNAKDDYFESVNPETGAGFLYDAVMSIGIGACLAQSNNTNNLFDNDQTISGVDHLKGIQSLNFHGASGKVIIAESPGFWGTRDSSYTLFGIFNLLPPNNNNDDDNGKGYVLSEYLNAEGNYEGLFNKPWTKVTKFIYANGNTIPPNNYIPEQNYLSPSVQLFGFILFGIATLLIILSILFIIINRKHRIVAASQPEFLLIICFGSLLINCTIIVNSFDESYGWSNQSLSRACIAGPWLAFIGYLLTYGALFSKLWRINKILQFARTKVDISHVVWPARIMTITTIIILTIWTILEPFHWKRIEKNILTGESIGVCKGTNIFWLLPAIIIIFIATILTFIMAWKTKDVDSTYSESKYVFILILVQLQTLLFCVPLVVILKGLSTNGNYIGFTLLKWTYPMTNMTLIMCPKMIAFYYSNKDKNQSETKKRQRGASAGNGGVAVSGISNPPSMAVNPSMSRFSALESEQMLSTKL